MLSPTLRQIEYALAIAQHGGLSAAAAALHVSQPALSVGLADLEAHLDRPLFLRRKGAPLQPTGFGAEWLAQAGRQVEGIAALFAAPGRRAVRLAVFEDLAPLVLAPLLARAEGLGLHPLTRPLGFAALSEALARGEVDAAATWDLGLPPGLVRVELARIAPQAVLAETHPLTGRAHLVLADLADQPLVLADQDLSIAHWRAVFGRAGLAPKIAHRVASLDLMRAYAAQGLGVGLSYAQPAPRISQDGTPFQLRALADAGSEALVLARQAGPATAIWDDLQRFLTSLFVPATRATSKAI
jgi:DNA-binding transcriptional LysR family regulator